MGDQTKSMNRGDNHSSIHFITNMPNKVAEPLLVTYRSVGIGLYGVAMRFMGMPLEKIALYMNSSQVSSGKGQFRQAIQLTFRGGYFAPYRVVGPASLFAWFFQYSVMGFAFQFFDHGLSQLLNVQPVYYGAELMKPPPTSEDRSTEYQLKYSFKTALAPLLSATLESMVSNRAEVQRYFGREQFTMIEKGIQRSALSKSVGLGMAFTPNLFRNQIMCQTTFLLTPITYKLYFPQEYKNPSTLFWYGLGMNMFVGNAVAITQQALWGRSLDYLAANKGRIDYQHVIRRGLEQEGMKAFFTIPKWSSRVMMNAPAQGVLPWFYNEILPMGESIVLRAFETIVYEPLLYLRVENRKSERTLRIFATREQPTFLSAGRENVEFAVVRDNDGAY